MNTRRIWSQPKSFIVGSTVTDTHHEQGVHTEEQREVGSDGTLPPVGELHRSIHATSRSACTYALPTHRTVMRSVAKPSTSVIKKMRVGDTSATNAEPDRSCTCDETMSTLVSSSTEDDDVWTVRAPPRRPQHLSRRKGRTRSNCFVAARLTT